MRVQLKGADDVYSPRMSKKEAQAELAKIRDVLGNPSMKRAALGVPDVTWMTAQGQNIVGAALVEIDDGGGLRLA